MTAKQKNQLIGEYMVKLQELGVLEAKMPNQSNLKFRSVKGHFMLIATTSKVENNQLISQFVATRLQKENF